MAFRNGCGRCAPQSRCRRPRVATARPTSSAIPIDIRPRANADYGPLVGAGLEDLCGVERTLGFERFVVVHAQVYGADFRLIVDALEAMPDHSHVRVIGRIDGAHDERRRAGRSTATSTMTRACCRRFWSTIPRGCTGLTDI